MLHPSFQKKLPNVIDLFKSHKISRAFAFGSVLTHNFTEKSDVDIIISFKDGLEPLEKGELMWDLQFALEDMLHREIDLIQETTPRNPYFIKELNETKMLIYGQ
jgi:predicted nucleotidyltransferase